MSICPESIHLHSYHSIRNVGRKILLLMSNRKEHEIWRKELLSPRCFVFYFDLWCPCLFNLVNVPIINVLDWQTHRWRKLLHACAHSNFMRKTMPLKMPFILNVILLLVVSTLHLLLVYNQVFFFHWCRKPLKKGWKDYKVQLLFKYIVWVKREWLKIKHFCATNHSCVENLSNYTFKE